MMPDCNGPALAEQLRRRIPGLKVLYISGYADAPFCGRGLLSDSAHFLAKPYTLRDLADKIREILES
jgi:FixJ family two-component response regulator